MRHRKALVLDKAQVAVAAGLVEKILQKQDHGLDLGQMHRFARHLEAIAGRTLEEFLELNQSVRDELHRAAGLLGRKYRKAESLHGLLRHIAGLLKQTVKRISELAGKIFVFLLGIVAPEKALSVRPAYLHT